MPGRRVGAVADGQVRVWRPDWPCPVVSVLHQQRHGGGDPTFRIDAHGRVWRGIRTPEGPATLAIHPSERAGRGARRGLGSRRRLGARLGARRCSARTTTGPASSRATRCWRSPGGATRTPGWAAAAWSWRRWSRRSSSRRSPARRRSPGSGRLVHRFGERAPGPGRRAQDLGPAQRRTRSGRSRPGSGCGCTSTRPVPARRHGAPGRRQPRAHHRAEPRGGRPAAAHASPASGVWTSAEVRQRAHGDPDAVSFGDYHVAKDVGWALTGTPFDDAELEEFLEPWRPQRGRVPALVGDGRPPPPAARPADGAAHPSAGPEIGMSDPGPVARRTTTRHRHPTKESR